MYLFQAIKLGRMMKTWCPGVFFSDDGLSSCANGAAMDAGGIAHNQGDVQKLCRDAGVYDVYDRQSPYAKRFPIVTAWYDEPMGRVLSYGSAIARRSNAGMSTDDLCAWLEPLERAFYDMYPDARPKELIEMIEGPVPEPEPVLAEQRRRERVRGRLVQALDVAIGELVAVEND